MNEFEGSVIAGMEAKLPAATIEMGESYTRGTHLVMEVELRVKNVRYEENRAGDLVRQHVLVIEGVRVEASTRNASPSSAGRRLLTIVRN